MVISETNFPHKFSALLPSFNLARYEACSEYNKNCEDPKKGLDKSKDHYIKEPWSVFKTEFVEDTVAKPLYFEKQGEVFRNMNMVTK